MSWNHIYDVQKPVGRLLFTIGKKFYLGDDNNYAGTLLNKTRFDKNREVICHVKRGFFSSMRPGNGSLLLNVNPTTTAFFPPENLHKWINRRRVESALSVDSIWKELKDLRVTFSGDAIDKPRAVWAPIGSITNRLIFVLISQ